MRTISIPRMCFSISRKKKIFFRIIENFNTRASPKNNIRGTFVNNKFLERGEGDFEVGISLFFGGEVVFGF